jgi:tRNA 2-thiouridine synthesizing protein C
MDIVYEDEDDDWAEKPSIRVISRAEMAELMETQDVVFSF